MNNTSINELNTILKGEYMAIQGYENYMEKVQDPNVKSELQRIQIDHKQNSIRIAERIQNLGGRPSSDVGVAGEIGQIFSSLRGMNKKDTKCIINQAYKGERNGIKMANEIVKGDLDPQSMTLINDILEVDKSHLAALDTLINQ